MRHFMNPFLILGLAAFFFLSCSADLEDNRIEIDNGITKEKIAKVMKLTDANQLAKIACEDEDCLVRSAAVSKLTDQTLLTKIAVEDDYFLVRETALKKITDQTLLVKLVETGKDQYVCARAAAELDESNPAIRRLAGNLEYISYDAVQTIARIKMVIQEPIIRKRIPNIEFEVELFHIKREYTEKDRNYASPSTHNFDGMAVVFKLKTEGRLLVKREWGSYSPPNTDLPYIHVEVEGAVFFGDIFHLNLFTKEDLAELSKSEIPEVRKAAIANLL